MDSTESISKEPKTLSLPYIDIQHDALAVFDDISQGVVTKEDIWISGYRIGSTSIHGKVNLELQQDDAATESGSKNIRITPRDGVEVEHESRTNFKVSFPGLDIPFTPLKFPRQVINPPYTRTKSTTPPLHMNTLAYSPQKALLAVGGPDGYLCTLPAGMEGKEESKLFKGHVGDVLDVKFFPSGEVVLSSSSDLSLRIWGLDGSNPRTLKGHARAITSTAILGVGKQVVSGSRDGTVRLWNVGDGKEVRKWTTEARGAVEEIMIDQAGERVLVCKADGDLEVYDVKTGEEVGRVGKPDGVGALNCAAWDERRGIVVTGHTSGAICFRLIDIRPRSGDEDLKVEQEVRVKRNEAAIYSLEWTGEGDLLVGTAAGLPCRLAVSVSEDGEIKVWVKEEYAGWEAVGVEAWAVTPDGSGVWCAGGEGGIRRY